MNFHSWSDEFRSTKLRRSKREVLGTLFLFSLLLSHVLPKNGLSLSQFLFCSNLILKLDMWPTLRHVFLTYPDSFLLLFRPGSSSIYFKRTLLNLFSTFEIFLKNPNFFFGSPSTQRPENRENSTVAEFNEIHLGN